MFRTIKNIFILILIGITASGMPIYASSINLNSMTSSIIPSKTAIIVDLEEKAISNDIFQIKYAFSMNHNKNYSNLFLDEENPFTLELTSNGKKIENISLDDLISEDNYKSLEFYNEEPIYITFNFDRNQLDLPLGSYNLTLYPNAKNKELKLDKTKFNIDFTIDGTYVHALSDTKEGMPLTLYFPNKEANFLVPITRFIPYTTTPLTKTLRNLEAGPNNELGLSNASPVPKEGTSGKSGNIAYVNLPSDLSPYNKGSASSTMAVHSIVNSLTAVDGISEVRFQFNGETKKEAFHGMIMDEPYYKQKEPMIYTAHLSTTGRFLLTPVTINKFNTIYNGDNIADVFELMKFNYIPKVYNSKIHPIIPNEVELLDYKINNDILTLTFNEEFENIYNYNKELKQMMIDGIIFTFTSLEDINSVNIQLRTSSEDSNTHKITTYDFEEPIYINPEV